MCARNASSHRGKARTGDVNPEVPATIASSAPVGYGHWSPHIGRFAECSSRFTFPLTHVEPSTWCRGTSSARPIVNSRAPRAGPPPPVRGRVDERPAPRRLRHVIRLGEDQAGKTRPSPGAARIQRLPSGGNPAIASGGDHMDPAGPTEDRTLAGEAERLIGSLQREQARSRLYHRTLSVGAGRIVVDGSGSRRAEGRGLARIPAVLADAQRRWIRTVPASLLVSDRSATIRRHADSACATRSRSRRHWVRCRTRRYVGRAILRPRHVPGSPPGDPLAGRPDGSRRPTRHPGRLQTRAVCAAEASCLPILSTGPGRHLTG